MCVGEGRGGREGGLLNFLHTIMYGMGRVKDKIMADMAEIGGYDRNWRKWRKHGGNGGHKIIIRNRH